MSLSPNEAARHGLKVNYDGLRRTAFDLLALPDVSIASLADDLAGARRDRTKDREQVEIDAKYAVYLGRQPKDIETFRRDEALMIPETSIIRFCKGFRLKSARGSKRFGRARWGRPAESRA